MNKLFLLLCIFIILPYYGKAQDSLCTAESLWKLGRVNLEDVSPDGNSLIYSVTYYNIEKNKGNTDLYLMSSSGMSPAVQLTSQEGAEYNARFRPDGKKITFLMASLLHEINLDGSQLTKLSDVEMNGFLWSPKADKIVYIADVKYRKNTTEIYPDLPLSNVRVYTDLMYRHWKSWDDYHDSNVFYVDYMNGAIKGSPVNIVKEAIEAPMEPNDGIEQVSVSPNGRYIAYSCKKYTGTAYTLNTNSDIYLYDLIEKTSINVSAKNLGYDKNPLFSPDGKFLLYNSMLTPGYEADKNRVSLYDLSSKTIKDLTAVYDNDCDNAVFHPDGKSIYFISAIKGCKQILKQDLNSGQVSSLTDGIHDINAFTFQGQHILATKVSMTSPAEVYKIDASSGKMQQLTTVNDAYWSNIKKANVSSQWIKTTDQQSMLVWVIKPPDFDPNKKYPTLLYCQGGPQSTVSQFFSYRWNFQLMASKGYIVVAPCRRGMPGFGQSWNLAISKDWGGQCMQDYLSAIDYMIQEPYVDKDNLGAIGASFGGYSVYYLAGNHNKRFKCFISHCGMFNMESWYGTTEEMWFANYDIGGPYWESEHKMHYEKFSPHKFAQNWDTPILILHGEKDFRVPLQEGLQAFQIAQLKGIPSKMVLFPEEGHWIQSPQNSLLWQREFYAWLGEYLKRAH